MRIKIGSLEITWHKKNQRARWSKANPPVEEKDEKKLANQVLEKACEIYCVDPNKMKTGTRCGEIPDARKIISFVLDEFGYSSPRIYNYLGSYLGSPATIRHHLLTMRTLNDKTHPKLFRALYELRTAFNLR